MTTYRHNEKCETCDSLKERIAVLEKQLKLKNEKPKYVYRISNRTAPCIVCGYATHAKYPSYSSPSYREETPARIYSEICTGKSWIANIFSATCKDSSLHFHVVCKICDARWIEHACPDE